MTSSTIIIVIIPLRSLSRVLLQLFGHTVFLEMAYLVTSPLMLLSGRVIGYFSFSLLSSNFSIVAVSISILSFCDVTCCRVWFDCCYTFLWVILYLALILFAVSTAALRFPDLLVYTIDAIAGFNLLKNCQIVFAAGIPLFRSTFF